MFSTLRLLSSLSKGVEDETEIKALVQAWTPSGSIKGQFPASSHTLEGGEDHLGWEVPGEAPSPSNYLTVFTRPPPPRHQGVRNRPHLGKSKGGLCVCGKGSGREWTLLGRAGRLLFSSGP